jgi:hypothetical protein
METKTNELKELFGYLHKKGVTEKTIDKKVSQWTEKDIIDLYNGLYENPPFVVPATGSLLANKINFSAFDFFTSPLLSGGRFPCPEFGCRKVAVDELVRFAALYAEHVLISYPIYDMREKLSKEGLDDSDRAYILADFKMLFYYRPLLEEGIIGLTPNEYFYCPNCDKEAIESFSKVEDGLDRFIEDNIGRFKLHYNPKNNRVKVEIPEEYSFSQHGMGYIQTPEKDEEFQRRDDKFFIKLFMDRSVSGVIQPYWHNASYLTNHKPEFEVLRYATDSRLANINTSLLQGLSHDLPFIHDVPFSKLIELRIKEGEAFKVYRDALRLALKTVCENNESKTNEIFDDVVLPELNKIDSTIKNSKRILTRSLSEDLIIGAGFIALGLMAGLISPTFGACISAIGGAKFISDIVKDATHIVSEPSNIRENSYYFLWKVKKESRKKARRL